MFDWNEFDKRIEESEWTSRTEYFSAPSDEIQFFNNEGELVAYQAPIYDTDHYVGVKYAYINNNGKWIETIEALS